MKKLRVMAFLGSSLVAAPVAANYLQPMPLEEQRAAADVVLLVRAGPSTTCEINAMRVPCVELDGPLYLKGQADASAAQRYLVTYSRAPELRVNCCRPGTTYLLFLRARGIHLYPVAGHWSVLPITGATAPTLP